MLQVRDKELFDLYDTAVFPPLQPVNYAATCLTFAAVLIGLTGLNSVSGSSKLGASSPSRTQPSSRRPSIALEVPSTTS